MANPENFVDLVCEGGGVKGIALVGAISVLEERGFSFQNLAGTSAGAIVATLVAAGWTSQELKNLLKTTPFREFTDPTWEDRIPLVGMPLSVILELGIYHGQVFLRWMREHLQEKDVHTFGDLVHPDFKDDPKYRYRVQVVVSDVTTHELLLLPRDARKLGYENPDDLDVAEAVRMSMSIPIFFEPVRHRNAQTRQRHVLVDGGMLSNFPVWVFDSDGPPQWPTFGLKMVAADPKATPPGDPVPDRPGPGIIDFLKSLVATMTEAHDRMYLEQDVFVRTITIPTLGVTATQFDLDSTTQEKLYEAGRTAAEEFLDKRWDFDAYVDAYRSGVEHHRSEETSLKP